MPNKPLRECAHPGCHELTTENRCPKHKRPAYYAPRETSNERGYNYKWGKAREGYLAHHPFCEECLLENKKIIATVVHHKVAHKGDTKLFWDKNNWQPLCKWHHDKHTAKGE